MNEADGDCSQPALLPRRPGWLPGRAGGWGDCSLHSLHVEEVGWFAVGELSEVRPVCVPGMNHTRDPPRIG